MSLLKKDRFSIRKIKGIVGSIFLGSLLFAPSVVGASTYHYLDYSNLTQTERDQLKQGRPDESKESYALVYEKDALPNTGQSQSIMTVLGLLTIGSLVVVITKDKRNKKIATFLIVGATGLVTLSTTSALNLNANIHESGRDGVLQISGYRYVGYLEFDERTVSSVSLVEQSKVMTDKGEPEVTTALPEAVVTEKGEPEVQQALPEAVVTEKGKPEVQPALPEAVVTEKGEPEVQQALPEAVVTEKGEPEVQAALSEAVVTEKGEPEVQPSLSEAVVTEKGEPEVQTALPEAVVTEKGEPEVQPELPEAVITDKGEPEVQTALPEAVVTEKGEPEVQPELPEAVITDKGEPEVQPELPAAVVTEKGEPEVQPSLSEAVVTEKGEPAVQPALPEAVVTEKGEPEVQQDLPEAVVTEKGEPEVQQDLPEAVVTEKGEPEVQQDLPEAVVTEKGEPEVQQDLPEAVVTEKGEPEVQQVLPEYTTKVAPTLTLDKVTEDAMARSAKLDYTLENTDNAEIKSIIAEIKDGDTVVKRVDLSKEKLTDAIQGLDLFKDYKIATTMTYNRGEGDETSKLDEKPLRLELKKVEIKNIASTNLVKVNDDGTETPSDFMTEKPSDKDVKKMYLKITSRDNKVTRLAVDKIEEVTEEGQKLYKITAEAQDLIQHTDPTKVRNKYVHYIEKPVPKVNNVYYNFNELVRDMQEHPNGEFKLGADLNATNVSAFGKSYVTKDFKGKLLSDGDNHYTIHNLSRPLFGNVIGGTIKNINLGNVDINMPWADRIAPIADTIKGGAKIEDVKVTGNVLGRNWVSGFIDKIDSGGTLRNVAFIGNVTSIGTGSSFLTGIVGENWKGLVEQAYVDANIRGKKAKAAGIAYWSQNSGNNHTVGREGAIKKSVVKGTIDVEEPIEVGGAVGSLKMHGSIEDSVSMMKVSNGEIFYGSSDIDYDDGYWTGNNVKRNYVVVGVSDGNFSYQRSKDKNRIKPISEEEAKSKIEATGITADKYEINEPVVNRLNRLTRKEDEYKSTQDYKVDRDLAYRNIEKLQPFYNKEWIVNQGNKLAEDSNLAKKEVLSVTGMKDGQFVTDLSDIDKIMIHYADGTKEEMVVTAKADSKVAQVKEYDVTGQNIVYTPNMVEKDRAQLLTDIKSKLSSVELESDGVRQLLAKRDTKKDANANSVGRQNGYIRDLFLEESFSEVKSNLDKLVKQILENEDHQLNDNKLAERALLKKVEDNKAKIMMGLTYLNRYYDIKYGDLSIKDVMMFKPDFYGKTASVIDRLINIGSAENNLKGDRTQDAYRDIISGATDKSSLHDFLTYNMKLFTNETDINVWFKRAIEKNAYVVEQPSTNPAFANKKYRLYEGLNNGQHGRMILPLLNLKDAHLFMISTYNTISFSSFEKYGKDTAEKREAFKSEINKRAKEQVNYLDFWSRLATDNVRDKLLKSQNGVPTPVWDNHNAPDGWPDRFGHRNGKPDYTPVREFFGRIGKYHPYQYGYGAYAYIFAAPQPMDAVYFVMTDLISDFGTSAFTHETTHVNDRMVYYGGYWHRQGTDLEAFAQGMLQTPDKSTTNGEYGALGINMAYHRPNDGNQWYNPDPDKLQTRDQIDHYMKNYNEAMMMLDYAEAEAVLPKVKGDNSKWFKKIDREIRRPMDRNKLSGPHQWDKVRDLTDAERITPLNTIDDLVNNNFMTIHGNPGNGRYRPEDFTPNSAYVNVNMMAGIYGGNTSDGAPGSLSFKHNAFRMWGYYGYENGFISYVSNKYKAEADKNNHGLLSDKLIINKVSKGNFNTLEEWKRHWYEEVLAKAKKGFESIDIDGVHISNYDELRPLFARAVQKDLDGMSDPKIKDHFKNTVDLKSKVFKALLKNTDGFFNKLFKEDI
ncbi:metalloendopeptidase [Streptococcus mitis]|uniref:Metalloendopeptidase n=3 Tax=Streptococcus TaxID=1301 RepID=A0A2N6P723_STROR|nr:MULTISPECIES: ZmpA/ZmpB/ZmpC family metallo-endopeptidase [Streptococcus]PKZ99096.1 metalloendopeptidase [Streptococcus mitis]PMB86507.1 metalloendopeptidase [Streptococcus oralis subsp. dentisani]